MATAQRARADSMIHDLGNNAAMTLRALGTDFLLGCTVLALGLVIVVFLHRRK